MDLILTWKESPDEVREIGGLCLFNPKRERKDLGDISTGEFLVMHS